MSLQSWKEVFYSTGAKEFMTLKQTPENELKAVNHCIRKWEGLSEENLKRHNLYLDLDDCSVLSCGGKVISIDFTSCALCKLHNNVCRNCVLYACGYGCNNDGSPYDLLKYKDPQPMIDALNECKQELENKIGTKQAY